MRKYIRNVKSGTVHAHNVATLGTLCGAEVETADVMPKGPVTCVTCCKIVRGLAMVMCRPRKPVDEADP